MKASETAAQQTRHSHALVACAALVLALSVSLPLPARAGDKHDLVVPAVPAGLQVLAGNSAFRVGHADGTQDYICLPAGAGFAWTFFGPQATLLDDDDEQIITHFLSPNLGPIAPEISGTLRATWQDSKDTSAIWAKAIASSSDAAFVATGAIPWLLLQIVGTQSGPTAGDRLTRTTYIQRLDTSGGVAPATGCAVSTDVGAKALVHYSANYFFFKADHQGHGNGHHDD